ncbi:MAG: hypothetical protein AAFR35_04665 [Pseudomonadota bacterium]
MTRRRAIWLWALLATMLAAPAAALEQPGADLEQCLSEFAAGEKALGTPDDPETLASLLVVTDECLRLAAQPCAQREDQRALRCLSRSRATFVRAMGAAEAQVATLDTPYPEAWALAEETLAALGVVCGESAAGDGRSRVYNRALCEHDLTASRYAFLRFLALHAAAE